MRVSEVDTPALLLELDRVERNIATMATLMASVSAQLRPHFKTPKCPDVARMQLAAGAIGITCAKLGEAEVLADAGVLTAVLIANQIVGPAKVRRLGKLAERLPELLFAVDHPSQVDAVAATAPPRSLACIVEVDVGMGRCGSDHPEQTLALAKHIAASPLRFRGIMGYEGHAVLIPEREKREQLAREAMAKLAEHREVLVAGGLEPEIVSAGGTGTCELTGSTPGVTEIQAGSYVFMDGAYLKVRRDFSPALSLLTTVIHRRGRLLVTDCGMKSLSHEFGMPRGAELPLGCVGLSEEHGHVLIDEGAELDLQAGDLIRLLPSHGDTTINLHDRYYVVRGDAVQAVWEISARGKFR